MTDRDDKTGDMLAPVAREVLVDLLLNGDNTPKNIAESIGRHRKNVSERLVSMEEEGLVEAKGGGVYTLTVEGVAMARAVRRNGGSDSY